MIKGYFDKEGHPKLEAEVSGFDAKTKIPALIDTGFDGDLSLPISIAIRLGLKLINTTLVTLADGSTKSELIFSGKVKIDSKRKDSYILLTGGEEALIGTQLLSDFRLLIDFPQKEVVLR